MERTVSSFPAAEWALAGEATTLIRRYPRLSNEELERLLIIFPRLPMLHVALMSSDEELAGRMEAFRIDHRRRLRTPASQLAALLSPIFLLLIVLVCLTLN